jgi:hypothetical protein
VRTRTSYYIVTNKDELDDYGLLPLPANEPDSEVVSMHTMMFLPPWYVPLLLLNPSSYFLHQVRELLYPALIDANTLQIAIPYLSGFKR